jgi:hypothetical protein
MIPGRDFSLKSTYDISLPSANLRKTKREHENITNKIFFFDY